MESCGHDHSSQGGELTPPPQCRSGDLWCEEKALFTSYPNLSDAANRTVVGPEIDGGVFLDRLEPHSVLQIQTRHRCYTAVTLGGSQALISGHPEYCPEPILVTIAGSTWGGSMLKCRFIGRGMRLEYYHPEYSAPIVTSRVKEIWQCARPLFIKVPGRFRRGAC